MTVLRPSVRASALDGRIERSLRKEGISFERDAPRGGAFFDFLVYGPAGRIVAIETKAWEPTRANISRAKHQAELYQRSAGLDRVLVVIEGLNKSQPSVGLVNEADLPGAIRSLWESEQRGRLHATGRARTANGSQARRKTANRAPARKIATKATTAKKTVAKRARPKRRVRKGR